MSPQDQYEASEPHEYTDADRFDDWRAQQAAESPARLDLPWQEIERIRRGGCACEKPEFYWAGLLSMYRCGQCGAVASPTLLPEPLKPKRNQV